MTDEEQLELVKKFYALSAARDPAAEELLTDDFVTTIPSAMPFGGVFRGKQAFQELIPLVADSVAVTNLKFVATTVGGGYAVEIAEFTLDGGTGPVQVAEVIQFREDQICEIRPFYPDPAPWIAAGARRNASKNSQERPGPG